MDSVFSFLFSLLNKQANHRVSSHHNFWINIYKALLQLLFHASLATQHPLWASWRILTLLMMKRLLEEKRSPPQPAIIMHGNIPSGTTHYSSLHPPFIFSLPTIVAFARGLECWPSLKILNKLLVQQWQPNCVKGDIKAVATPGGK